MIEYFLKHSNAVHISFRCSCVIGDVRRRGSCSSAAGAVLSYAIVRTRMQHFSYKVGGHFGTSGLQGEWKRRQQQQQLQHVAAAV